MLGVARQEYWALLALTPSCLKDRDSQPGRGKLKKPEASIPI